MRRIAADAVVIHKGKVLLIRRRNPPFKGMLALPGGMLEDNETLEQCAVREAREEAGAVVRPLRLVGVYSHPKRDPRGTVSVAFRCKFTGGTLSAGSDAASVQWVPVNRLPKLAFDHNNIIRDSLARRSGVRVNI
ncbi:MAG: NUDIX hydrolase [Candidatus Micrarchaeia archaeon]